MGNPLAVNGVNSLKKLLEGFFENHNNREKDWTELKTGYDTQRANDLEDFKNRRLSYKDYQAARKQRDLDYSTDAFGILNGLMSDAGIHPLQDAGAYGESTDMEIDEK